MNTFAAGPINPDNKITAVSGITDARSLFAQSPPLSGNEVFSWASQTTGNVKTVTIDASGFPVFEGSDEPGGAVLQYNYETSSGANDWTNPGNYTADLQRRKPEVPVVPDSSLYHSSLFWGLVTGDVVKHPPATTSGATTDLSLSPKGYPIYENVAAANDVRFKFWIKRNGQSDFGEEMEYRANLNDPSLDALYNHLRAEGWMDEDFELFTWEEAQANEYSQELPNGLIHDIDEYFGRV